MKQMEEPRERGNYRPVERTPEERERIKKWIETINEDMEKRKRAGRVYTHV